MEAVAVEDALVERIRSRQARIAIVGLGYVGLPTAIHLAGKGFHVTGADIDAAKVESVNAGRNPLPELGLDVAGAVAAGRLTASSDVTQAARDADVVSIIVPTPVDEDKHPDLSMVRAASEAVANGLRPGKLVVLESTTYPGTCEEVLIPALEETGLRAGRDFGVAYCPERYNPGDPDHTLDNVHRVLGAITPAWAEAAKELYGSLNGGRITVLSDLRTAEATKVIENVQRDLNIALANELAIICERLGIDVHEVLDGAVTKWNFHDYRPGPGVGGHCLPVDPYYLTTAAQKAGYTPKVILAGREVNDGMPAHVVKRLDEALGGLEGKKIACLGLAYKANTGDARESSAVAVVFGLQGAGAEVAVHDPHVAPDDIEELLGVRGDGLEAVLRGSDAVVLLTDHDEYLTIAAHDLVPVMAGRVAFDTRRRWDVAMFDKAGVRLLGLGRGWRGDDDGEGPIASNGGRRVTRRP